MLPVIWVALGGALGSAARYGVNVWSGRVFGDAFPWHTLIVNVAGCFVMGLLTGLMAVRLNLSNELRIFLTTGVLGGFTTFSAFSFEVFALYERGQVVEAALYVVASVVLSILGVFAGFHLFRAVLS